MHIRELYRVCCMSSSPGSRLACISNESEGEDLIAPDMASSAVCCVWAIFLAVFMEPCIGALDSEL